MALVRWLARSFGLTDPQPWGVAYPAGNAAGKVVTVDTALQLATVWSCVRLIAETVGTLPLFLYRRDGAGDRSVAADHLLYGLLHDQPHADYTAVEFWEGMTASLCVVGNAFAEKLYSGPRLIGLEPMRADLVTVRRDRNGARVYTYTPPDGQPRRELGEDRVFHVRGFGGAGDLGLSPIAMARQSLGLAMAADESAAKMFANGVRPTGVLTVDQILKPDQRKMLKDNIVAPLAGSSNAGGIFVLEAGMKFQPIAMSLADAEMLATRKFSVEEICRWFRVPPFMVGHTEKSTSWGTGLEQQQIGFLTFALRPYLTRIEQAIRRSLLRPEERARLYAEYEVDGLLRADSKTRTDNLVKLTAGGLMTRNEARRLMNLPPKPGGDELTVQAQNVPIGHNGGPPLDDEAAQREREAA